MSQNKTTTLASNAKKIAELASDIAVYSEVQLEVSAYGKIQTLRDKLDFILVNLEIEGQEAKIKSMMKVLRIMKEAKVNETAV